jgi:amino acid transporter
LAPVGLLLVAIMLYFFKGVYAEVVTAIPVNGGTYNVMLNTATKKIAAFVACLSILAYTATAIVSAFDSVLYLSLLWPEVGKGKVFMCRVCSHSYAVRAASIYALWVV